MQLTNALVGELRVDPGSRPALHERSTATTRTTWLGTSGRGEHRRIDERDLEAVKEELAAQQQLLFAADTWAVLCIFQALDAGGKDGTIKHVISGVNAQGCSVVSFKQPSEEELDHDFLWRCERVLPARGRIGIFNRSYYEEVLVTAVHPELLEAERLPRAVDTGALMRSRFEDINAFERHLERSGTRVLKFFLHVSKDEQRRRLIERIDDPTKNWKYSPDDLAERAFFDDYIDAYERAIAATSTKWAPWYVVPADHKRSTHALVIGILAREIEALKLAYPTADKAALAAARAALIAEGD